MHSKKWPIKASKGWVVFIAVGNAVAGAFCTKKGVEGEDEKTTE